MSVSNPGRANPVCYITTSAKISRSFLFFWGEWRNFSLCFLGMSFVIMSQSLKIEWNSCARMKIRCTFIATNTHVGIKKEEIWDQILHPYKTPPQSSKCNFLKNVISHVWCRFSFGWHLFFWIFDVFVAHSKWEENYNRFIAWNSSSSGHWPTIVSLP